MEVRTVSKFLTRLTKLVLLAGICAGLAASAAAPSAAKVTRVTLKFGPSRTKLKYSGACPLRVDLIGNITATGRGQVRFQMLADGHVGIWHEEVMDFSGSGTKEVHKALPDMGSNVWKPGSRHTGWYTLKVLAPQQMESDKAEYEITCR